MEGPRANYFRTRSTFSGQTPSVSVMNSALKNNKKRKQTDKEQEALPAPAFVQLEMLTDEEEADEVSSDDGEAEEFPEINADSDTEEENRDTEDDKEDLSDEDEHSDDTESEDDSDSSDTSLHIFPKAKTVISNITGQRKVVYPDIDPEYDSDSSTEDVRLSLVYSNQLV